MGMWSNSSRAQMRTNPAINSNQGGGSKKAGLPNSIGQNTAWDNIHLNNTSQRLSVLTIPWVSKVRQSRPVGSRPESAPYWNMF